MSKKETNNNNTKCALCDKPIELETHYHNSAPFPTYADIFCIDHRREAARDLMDWMMSKKRGEKEGGGEGEEQQQHLIKQEQPWQPLPVPSQEVVDWLKGEDTRNKLKVMLSDLEQSLTDVQVLQKRMPKEIGDPSSLALHMMRCRLEYWIMWLRDEVGYITK